MKRRVILHTAGVLSAIALLSCQQKTAVMPESEYGVLTVAPSNETVETVYSAAIKGKQDIDIYPQISGVITKVCVEEGEKVKKGQILFVIDQVAYLAALQTAEANVMVAEATVATAQLTYESKEQLHAQNIISDFELQTAKNSLLSAKAQLAQMKAQEVNAKNNLSFTEVKSPSEGVVGTLPYRLGALVSPSMQKPLTTISDNTQMYAYFSLNETQLLALTEEYGSKDAVLEAMPGIDLKLSNNSIYGSKGKIESISGVVDKTTGTVNLRAAFPNDKGILYSGTSANVVLPVVKENVVVIPQIATFEIQDKVFVYKVVDGKAQSAMVKVSPVNGGRDYIVLEGLQPGETIVSEGVGLLREGTPIKPKSGKGA